jgi:hypothetical protein
MKEEKPRMRCADCKFVVRQRTSRESIHRAHVCRFLPPQQTTIPQPQGLVVACQFPIVQPDFWCWQFKPREGGVLENEIAEPIN